ncbi:MAG: four helix bundle protein [Candidatus Moranbacteria bacterium]|nr:four helix bundle protein [Candidatus Moranbacteria bacterium]
MNQKPKAQSTKPRQNTKPETGQSTNDYRELEQRTTDFAKRVLRLTKALPKNCQNIEMIKQITRSSGSIGANYREANEALTKKDFLYRIRISRKEAKETDHWLQLIQEANPEFSHRMKELFVECRELRNIFSAIINKVQKN